MTKPNEVEEWDGYEMYVDTPITDEKLKELEESKKRVQQMIDKRNKEKHP